MWQKQLPDEGITQHTYWLPQRSIKIRRLTQHRCGSKQIQIKMIATPAKSNFAVPFAYRISPTFDDTRCKGAKSTPNTVMWHVTQCLWYQVLAMIPDRQFGSGSRSKQNIWQIGGLGYQ